MRAIRSTFESSIGLAYDRVSGDEVAGHVDVCERILNSQHTVPLGVFAALAESAAWEGTVSQVPSDTLAALNLENNTMMTGMVYAGRISVLAQLVGQTSDCWTWVVKCHDDADRLCATSTVLVAPRGRTQEL